MPQNPTKSPSSNPASATEEPETGGFLQRWSQRKADAAAPEPKDPAEAATLNVNDEPPPGAIDGEEAGGPEADEAAPPVTEADLENLTYQSDYTKFMGEQVPEAIRRRALRQLWRSDPILANLDGLCDYDDDFTDAALAVKVLKTAHQVGQGYLTDEEVAANRARGKPPEEAVNDGESIDDEGEDMEDFDEMEDVDGEIHDEEALNVASAEDNPPDTASQSSSDAQDTGPETKAS